MEEGKKRNNNNNNNKEFSCFEVVSDDSDHYYVDKNVEGRDTKSSASKRIIKEWQMLEQNLPDSIYVRAYKRRIDLLRAVIIGAPGTPYHDGLFFFDIFFPDDYPHSPPKFHYRSFGFQLNPNIYSSGKICLSLLNTWRGEQSERWDPSSSTILQVLLSIQALVLNDQPFFNEVPSVRRWQCKSTRLHYNHHVFALTCLTSLHLIRRPPKNFEPFIKAHFRLRGSLILSASKEYVNGRVTVGYYNHHTCSTTTTSLKVSTDFQHRLQAIYNDMFEAFLWCGAFMEPSLKTLELEKKVVSKVRFIYNIGAQIKHVLAFRNRKSKKQGRIRNSMLA